MIWISASVRKFQSQREMRLRIPKRDEVKDTHKKNLVKAKRIIADSIKDHLIPHVSSLKTPKEVFDAF